MIDGRLSPEELVAGAGRNDDELMKNALMSTTLSNINRRNRIII